MFSKSKINEPGPKAGEQPAAAADLKPAGSTDYKAPIPKAKPPASVLSADLNITGNIKSSGDIQIEGQVDGDIRAHLLTIGEGATVRGECTAEDVVINGRIIGRVRGLKVRLTSTARVEGDIIHKTIAIESGAHFEGSVQRQDDPINPQGQRPAPAGQQGAGHQTDRSTADRSTAKATTKNDAAPTS